MYRSIIWAIEKSATIVSLNGLNEAYQFQNIRNVIHNFQTNLGWLLSSFGLGKKNWEKDRSGKVNSLNIPQHPRQKKVSL